jgi:hypothetical protein
MELVLKSNNEQSIAKIIALAKKLDVTIEKKAVKADKEDKTIKERILNFKAASPSSFGDAADWQKEQREDRNLPFS